MGNLRGNLPVRRPTRMGAAGDRGPRHAEGLFVGEEPVPGPAQPLPRSARLVHTLQPKTAPPPVAWIEELDFAASLPRGSMHEDLKRLNAWLKATRGRDIPEVPPPERALEIFDNEKRRMGHERRFGSVPGTAAFLRAPDAQTSKAEVRAGTSAYTSGVEV